MKRLLACLLIVVVVMSNISLGVHAAENDPVEQFVTRLYNICLDRNPDTTGLNDWVASLKTGEKSGAQVAYGFIFSTEFKNKNLCNSCYLDSLYRCFLGRTADDLGKADWLNQLEGGKTRGEIFNGFVGSQEFSNICSDYGIVRGTGDWSKEHVVVTGDCQNCGQYDSGIEDFIKRLYVVCLDREAEAEGLEYWIGQAKQGKSGAEIAYGFVFSTEFQNKNLCDIHFLDYMYLAFFDREADAHGQRDWLSKLSAGCTKGTIFNGFTGSQEFANLCNSFGIKAGNVDYSKLDFKPNGDCKECLEITDNEPAYGTVCLKQEDVDWNYDWNHGTIYHSWNGESWETSYQISFVTDERITLTIMRILDAYSPTPVEPGYEGEIRELVLWIYLHGEVKEPEPEYGTISFANEDCASIYVWDSVTRRYVWNGQEWETEQTTPDGLDGKEYEEIMNIMDSKLSEPTDLGTEGEIRALTLWIYLGAGLK